LLADDSVTIQRVIELTFADEDINVVAVSDGDQAIARINSSPPDIVLVDVGMPGRSGYEVAQHVKQAPGLDHIPVLLLTGAFEPVDQQRAAEAGCDGILAKPFEPQQVIARVKELLGRPSSESRPARSVGAPFEPPLASAPFEPPLASVPFEPPLASVPFEAPRPRTDRTTASEVARLDNYFAQLDAAFATLSEGRPAEPPPADAGAGSVLTIDWFGAAPGTASPSRHDAPAPPAAQPEPPGWQPQEEPSREVVDRPAADTPPPMDAGPSGSGSVAPPEQTAAPVAEPAAASPAPELPSMADAFATILAAEQNELAPLAPPSWPAPAVAPQPAEALTDEAMEEISRRVMEKLTDRVVRETVTELVSNIAERLIREEIEKIKNAIK
jgi:CheY-like chemotaxis protein